MLLLAVATLICAIAAHPHQRVHMVNETVPSNCPGWTLYKQCDGAWGNNRLGTSGQTICQAGCAMSSVAMLLSTRGCRYDPGSLNSWLTGHGGYVQGDELVWGAADALGCISFQGIETPALSDAVAGVNACHGLVANVRGGSHWVLLTSYAGNNVFNVNDPGFSQGSYPFSEMLRMAVYH